MFPIHIKKCEKVIKLYIEILKNYMKKSKKSFHQSSEINQLHKDALRVKRQQNVDVYKITLFN